MNRRTGRRVRNRAPQKLAKKNWESASTFSPLEVSPEDLEGALKFGLCVPRDILKKVMKVRIGAPAAVKSVCGRRPKLIRAAGRS
jgi:hypothetical protein